MMAEPILLSICYMLGTRLRQSCDVLLLNLLQELNEVMHENHSTQCLISRQSSKDSLLLPSLVLTVSLCRR